MLGSFLFPALAVDLPSGGKALREAEHARWILSQAQPPGGTVLLDQSQQKHHYLNVIFMHVIQAVTQSPPAASVVL